MSESNDPRPSEEDCSGARLSAWLDGELPQAESEELGPRIEADAELAHVLADLRHADGLLRDWYAALPVSASAACTLHGVPAPQRARRWLPLALLAAASVAIVALLVPWMQGSHARSFAEEAVEHTGRAARAARGLLAKFTIQFTRKLEQPDKAGNKQEARKAAGEVRFGPLHQERIVFCSREVWEATADEPELIRTWAQTKDGQSLREQQGGSVTEESFSHGLPLEEGRAAFHAERNDASPVDVRTRRAVEGLARLVRSFSRDTFQNWMGYRWTLKGGTGAAADPWVYATHPDSAAAPNQAVARSTAAEKVLWTLKLSIGKQQTIEKLVLEEQVSGPGGDVLSTFSAQYELKFRNSEWPEGGLAPGTPLPPDGREEKPESIARAPRKAIHVLGRIK